MWNPELFRGITPPTSQISKEGYALRVAPTHVELFSKIESQLTYLKIKDVRIHQVVQGETLAKLAKRYHVSIQKILKMNPQLKPRNLRVGMKVSVPIPEMIDA